MQPRLSELYMFNNFLFQNSMQLHCKNRVSHTHPGEPHSHRNSFDLLVTVIVGSLRVLWNTAFLTVCVYGYYFCTHAVTRL